MGRKLFILPFNTELLNDQIASIAKRSIRAFPKDTYHTFEILDRREMTPHQDTGSIFAPDVVLKTYSLLNGIPGQGIHSDVGSRLSDTEHAAIITDMMINYGGYRAGGIADRENGTALATTRDLAISDRERSQEKLIRRLRGVVIHELGHLFSLEHHDMSIGRTKFCPMMTRGWGDPEFENERRLGMYLDSRAAQFCDECKRTIMGYRV